MRTITGLALAGSLQPFDAGNLRGEPVYRLSQLPETGKMTPDDSVRLREAQRKRRDGYMAGQPTADFPDAPIYIVYSYRTPVVWVQADGTVNVADGNLSTTSNNHRRMAAEAIRTGRKIVWVRRDFDALRGA